MLKVFMQNNEDFIIDMGDESKEMTLLYKFMNGVSSEGFLKLNTKDKGTVRIKVADINNMQFFREEAKPKKKKPSAKDVDNFVSRMLADFIRKND